jgi:hypothetical protein
VETGVAYHALMAGFALPFIAAFIFGIPYIAFHVVRRIVEP